MKKMMRICTYAFLLLTFASSVVWSKDFDDMSNIELFELRGSIQNTPFSDRNAYRLEWEKRLAGMTDEEKSQFTELSEDAEKDNGEFKQPSHIMGQGYEIKEWEGPKSYKSETGNY